MIVVENIKEQIRSAQHKAILNANKKMLILYLNIGKVINENSTWGSKFLSKLSSEITSEFPSTKGFSVRNFKNMARFYREYPEIEFGQSVTTQITWTHNIEILRVKSKEKDLEDVLINNITKLLLELGKGFAYVRHQYHLEIAGEDYYIDLLFYNIKLKCLTSVEYRNQALLI